jgi:hypothetical protein
MTVTVGTCGMFGDILHYWLCKLEGNVFSSIENSYNNVMFSKIRKCLLTLLKTLGKSVSADFSFYWRSPRVSGDKKYVVFVTNFSCSFSASQCYKTLPIDTNTDSSCTIRCTDGPILFTSCCLPGTKLDWFICAHFNYYLICICTLF